MSGLHQRRGSIGGAIRGAPREAAGVDGSVPAIAPGVVFDEKKIDSILTSLNQCALPGAAVGIAINGRPVYRKGFGLASMELPVVLSPSIRMRIGSTTKHFTAFAYMLMCEEGRAHPDDPLEKYFPELHRVTHKVTMRQLMGNTSGLRDANDIRFQFSGTTGRRTTRSDLVSLYRHMDDTNTRPGEAWIYNNGGWVLLTAVLEKIAGESFEDLMRKRIFEPLGMHDTQVRSWDNDFVSNSASPHTLNREGKLQRLFWDQDYAGAGAITSTVDDMLRWAANMDAHRLGSAETWELMKAPQTLPNGSSTGYALGLIASRYRGVEVIHHPGGGTGCNAQLLKLPAAGLDVVMMINRDDVSSTQLVYEILDAMLTGLLPVKKHSGPFATGLFRSPKTGRVIQLLEREGQQIVSTDGLDLPYEPDGSGMLWPIAESVHFRRSLVLVGAALKPTSLRFSDFGIADELVPVEPAERSDPAAIVGRYRSDATGTEVTVSRTPEGVQLHSFGRFGSTESTLECITDGIWRASTTGMVIPPWATLSFDGPRVGFNFTNFTTRSLPFRRIA